jgi:predicted RNA-binding protein YlqC (UPF0109 family)
VPDPDAVRVEESEANGVIILSIYAPPVYRPLLIGKRGQNVEAVRTVMRAVAGRLGLTILVNIPDEQPPEGVPQVARACPSR